MTLYLIPGNKCRTFTECEEGIVGCKYVLVRGNWAAPCEFETCGDDCFCNQPHFGGNWTRPIGCKRGTRPGPKCTGWIDDQKTEIEIEFICEFAGKMECRNIFVLYNYEIANYNIF